MAAVQLLVNRQLRGGWLERAASHRIDQLIYAGVHPAFKGLQGDPRFTAVLERVGVLR